MSLVNGGLPIGPRVAAVVEVEFGPSDPQRQRNVLEEMLWRFLQAHA